MFWTRDFKLFFYSCFSHRSVLLSRWQIYWPSLWCWASLLRSKKQALRGTKERRRVSTVCSNSVYGLESDLSVGLMINICWYFFPTSISTISPILPISSKVWKQPLKNLQGLDNRFLNTGDVFIPQKCVVLILHLDCFRFGGAEVLSESDRCHPERCCVVASHRSSNHQQSWSQRLRPLVRNFIVYCQYLKVPYQTKFTVNVF